MSFFHLILDYSVNNSYSLFRWVNDKHPDALQPGAGVSNSHDMLWFKTEIAIALCKRKLRSLNTSVTRIKSNIDEISDVDSVGKKSDVDTRIRVSKENRNDNNPIAQDTRIRVSKVDNGKKISVAACF